MARRYARVRPIQGFPHCRRRSEQMTCARGRDRFIAGAVKKSFFSAAVKAPAGWNTKAFISARTYAEDANSLANVAFPNITCGCDE